MSRFLFIILLIVSCQLSFVNFSFAADKPVKYKTLLSEARAAIKNGKNQANAEKNLLAVVNREDMTRERKAEIYFLAEELQRSMNSAENMKLYLKQSYDTLKFFSTILQMHEYLLLCDSVEMIPDELGVTKFRHRHKSREILLNHRSNLLNGGKFLLRRGKYAESFPYFNVYLRSAQSQIFGPTDAFVRNDSLLPRVAYWATISAYNSNEARKALTYIDQAIKGAEPELRTSLQEYKVRCFEALKDNENWVKNLEEGVQLYPAHDYFFLHLIDYYAHEKMYDRGISLCENMLKRVGDRSIYWLGLSQMNLEKQDYDRTIEMSNEAIRCDSTMDEAYYNKGMAFLTKAAIFAEIACNDIRNPKCKSDRAKLMLLYQSAKEPMERVRQLIPNDSKKWASPLYRIYLNLNMGREFAEMEKILSAQ